VLEVLCDTTGRIEFARVIDQLSPSYDRALVAATKQWKFHPATKDGAPVRYRWLMEVVLNPRWRSLLRTSFRPTSAYLIGENQLLRR
jgi:hypothetical protein